MVIKKEADFLAKFPRLHLFTVKTAAEEGVDLNNLQFQKMELYDDEYAYVYYDGWSLAADGSETTDWNYESSGRP